MEVVRCLRSALYELKNSLILNEAVLLSSLAHKRGGVCAKARESRILLTDHPKLVTVVRHPSDPSNVTGSRQPSVPKRACAKPNIEVVLRFKCHAHTSLRDIHFRK